MADRFPLILNTSASQIQEIASGDQLDLTGNNIANAGIVTATAFHGDGSNLTNAGVSLSGSTNNTIATVSGADALVGESNLTFDSSTNKLAVTAADSYVNIGSNSNRLELRNSGSSSYLYHYGGGGTFHIALAGSSNTIQFDSISQTIAQFKKGAECSLYYSNTKRFETTNTGAKVTGDLSVTGVLTYEDVTNVDSVGIITARSGIDVTGVVNSTVAGGDNNLQIETTSSGDPRLKLAAAGSGGHDIEYIRSSNTLNFKQAGGSVRLSINSAGHLLPGTDSQYNIGSNAVRFASIYADTLYGDGSALTGISAGVAGISTTGISTFSDVQVGGAITCTGTIVNKIDSTTENGVIIGFEANQLNTNTDNCVMIGHRAGYQNATGKSNNTFIGYYSGYGGGGTVGDSNTMIGSAAGMFMYDTTTNNVAVGKESGYYNNGHYCVSIGSKSGISRGTYNTAIGGFAYGAGNSMDSNYMTYNNTASNQWGDNNIVIGYQANLPTDETDNYIVIGNKKNTNFVIGTLGVEVTAGVTTHAGSVIVGAGASVVGIVTTNSGLDLSGLLREEVTVTAGKLSDNTNIDLGDGMVHYFTTQETTTSRPNLRFNSSTTLNSVMNVNESISVTIITTAAAAAYSANLNIDGSTSVVVNWIGGSAPSAGGSSGLDIYTYTIIKTSNATYKVIGNLTKTS